MGRTKMLAQQHQMAIRAQDVYEDDAELDCNEYAKSLAQDKSKDGDAFPSSAAPPSWGQWHGDQSSLSRVAKVDDSMAKCESQGADSVLGCNSDGILFVASRGKVLRNEGPLRPKTAACETRLERSRIVWSLSSPFSNLFCCPTSFAFLR